MNMPDHIIWTKWIKNKNSHSSPIEIEKKISKTEGLKNKLSQQSCLDKFKWWPNTFRLDRVTDGVVLKPTEADAVVITKVMTAVTMQYHPQL